MQEARAERAPEPEADEETLQALQLGQMGINRHPVMNPAGPNRGEPRRIIQPRINRDLEL